MKWEMTIMKSIIWERESRGSRVRSPFIMGDEIGRLGLRKVGPSY
jgi:hypothetical protein